MSPVEERVDTAEHRDESLHASNASCTEGGLFEYLAHEVPPRKPKRIEVASMNASGGWRSAGDQVGEMLALVAAKVPEGEIN